MDEGGIVISIGDSDSMAHVLGEEKGPCKIASEGGCGVWVKEVVMKAVHEDRDASIGGFASAAGCKSVGSFELIALLYTLPTTM